MTTILIRTLIVYVFLILTVRLMGKRQIGELEVTDLVTTLLISEIASLPITNQDIPILYAVVPMITLLALEVLSSVILTRIPKLRGLVSARPTVIIRDGILDQTALRELRISIDELASEIRQQGLTGIDRVDCAILEKNGKLTVIPKAKYGQPSAEDLGLSPKDGGLSHIVYSNGDYSDVGLRLIGKDRPWLDRQIGKRGLCLSNLFCVTADRDGKLYWIPADERKKPGKE